MSATQKPYSAREVATMLGMSVDTLYRRRCRLTLDHGMPGPITRTRPFKWHRGAFDAWLDPRTRGLLATLIPANDVTPAVAVTDRSDDAQREFLHKAYAP